MAWGKRRWLAALGAAQGLLFVLSPPVSAEDTILVTVAIPQTAEVGQDITATVTLTSLNHQTPATTLHVTYDGTVLQLTGDDALNCHPANAGTVDCAVPEMQFSFAYPFQFHVLQKVQTTVTGSDSGATGSGTLNVGQSPPPPPPPPTSPPYEFASTIPFATEGIPYTALFLTCSGNPCPLNLAPKITLADGELPPGISFSQDGVLSGTPTALGNYSFRMDASDGSHIYGPSTQFLQLIVEPADITQDPTPDVPKVILPSNIRTPGAINPSVTQSTIKKTICVANWIKKIQPTVSYTNTLKLKQMKQYGEKGRPTAYEEDHFIPLELGGAPRNPKNLWPEPHRQSQLSDPLETSLKRKVCAGNLSLGAARKQIIAYKRKHG